MRWVLVGLLLWGSVGPRALLPVMARQSAAVLSQKKGCAGCSCAQLAAVGTTATYGYNPAGFLCDGGQFRYPMVRSASDGLPSRLPEAVSATGVLMGFNEPDNCRPGGTCTSLEDVVTAWPTLEALCGEGCTLVGPAPTNETRDWYRRFFAEYRRQHGRDPKLDVLAVHCAFTPDAVDWCITYTASQISLAAQLGITRVWVTEFAALPMEDWSIREAKAAGERYIRWLEAQARVERYFIFAGVVDPAADWAGGGLWNSLYWATDPGRLTYWGEWYARQPGTP